MKQPLRYKTVTFTETKTGSVVIEERYSTSSGDTSRVELDQSELRRFLAWASGNSVIQVQD